MLFLREHSYCKNVNFVPGRRARVFCSTSLAAVHGMAIKITKLYKMDFDYRARVTPGRVQESNLRLQSMSVSLASATKHSAGVWSETQQHGVSRGAAQ